MRDGKLLEAEERKNKRKRGKKKKSVREINEEKRDFFSSAKQSTNAGQDPHTCSMEQ
jgi:hypothetical protein